MRSLFIWINEQEKFDIEKLLSDIKSIPNTYGIKDVSNVLDNTILDWEYQFAEESNIFSLGKSLNMISTRGLDDASLHFAIELQKREKRPLRIFNDNYDFHFSIENIKSLEELKQKIQEGYFDEEALAMEREQDAKVF